jgi:hypothetical protein
MPSDEMRICHPLCTHIVNLPPDGKPARHYRKPYEILPIPPHVPDNEETQQPKNQTPEPQLYGIQVYEALTLYRRFCLA